MSNPIHELKLVSALPTANISDEYVYLLTEVDGQKLANTFWLYNNTTDVWSQVNPTTVTTNIINESTTNAGVTIEGVLIKDSAIAVDHIGESTSTHGVVIDSVLLKDNTVTVGNGNATTPSIKVGEESGLYLSSAGTLGVSVSGTYVGRFTVKKGLELNDSTIGGLRTGATVVNNNTDPSNKATFASDLVVGKIFTGTPSGNIDYTLPTGTEMDTANDGLFLAGYGQEVPVINLSANTITLVASSGFTIVGNAVVSATTSAKFKVVKTGTNTYIAYRLS